MFNRKEYIKPYMREWRKRHPGYNYAAVQRWKTKLREKLGEEGFLAWQRAKYRKYRDRILASEKLRKAKIDPVIRKEQEKKFRATYKAKYPEKIKAYGRAYELKYREQRRSFAKKARDANPELTKVNWRKRASLRRARKRAATIGDLTDIAKVYERAKWWKQWFAVEVDHVISLAKGGTHEAKNLQIIYDFENRKKHARADYKPRVVFV